MLPISHIFVDDFNLILAHPGHNVTFTHKFHMNEAFDAGDNKIIQCSNPMENEIRCKIEYDSPLTDDPMLSWERNEVYYDWGMIMEIAKPELGISTKQTFLRLND